MQGKCSWYSVQPGWSPNLYDRHIAIQQGAAIGATDRTVDILMQKVETWFQMKNMSNSRCDITMYKLFPKRDIPLNNAATVVGVQGTTANDMLPLGATSATLATYPGAPGTFRIPVWNEHDYDLFENTIVPDMFRVKKVMRKFLEPGQFFVLKYADRKEKVRGYGDFGMLAATALSTVYQHLREFGPLWLFRVQGSNQHSSAVAVTPLTDATTGATMGSYNVEVYARTKTTSYGAVGTAPKKYIAMETARLTTMPYATEQGFEVRQAQNAPMDVQ